MKKLSKLFLLMLSSIFGIFFFIQRAYGDLVIPGDSPARHGRLSFSHIPPENIIPYIATGVVIVVVIIVSITALIKIAKKK